MIDVTVGFILMLLGLSTFIKAGFFPKGATIEMNPGFYPQILGVIIILFGLILILKNRTKIVKESFSFKLTRDEIRPFLLLGLMIAYLITFNFLGFITSTLLFMACVVLFFKGSYINAIICPVLGVTFFYLLFRIGFKTPLPNGIFNLFF